MSERQLGPSDVTLVRDAIHNPSEPRHFMQVVPAARRQVATIGGAVVADSSDAVVVKEVGRGIYDPIVYFPRADVAEGVLAGIDRTTHCPLKGDTEYFDLVVGADRHAEAAWSYVTLVTDNPLQGLVAFDPAQVRVGVDGS